MIVCSCVVVTWREGGDCVCVVVTCDCVSCVVVTWREGGDCVCVVVTYDCVFVCSCCLA